MTSYTAPGAWIDDRVPDELADLLDGIEIDPAAFSAWLAERLADLRFQREIRSQLPTRSDEVEALRDYVAALAAVAKFQPGGLPPKAQTFLATEGLRAGTPWHDAARKFQFDAIELHAVAARALSRAE